MRTPKFWQTKNKISDILMPLGDIYNYFTQKRIAKAPDYVAPVPVICVGNITAGGTGKTPVTMSIAKMLDKPYILSRGYGGKLYSAVVDPFEHTYEEVGDEPLLLAKNFPTIINANRAESAKQAVEMGAKTIVMDDGLQNPSLKKNLSFIVIDGGYGFGNHRFIPAGPMREKKIRADAVILVGEDKFNIAKKIKKPVFFAKIEPIKPRDTDKTIYAFAGIGRPQKFYDSLRECGFGIAKKRDFPDHHKYTRDDYQLIRQEAAGLEVWTTAKDFVKIPVDLKKYFKVLEIEIKWQDEKALKGFIASKI